MDGCLLVPRLNGNKLYGAVGSDLELTLGGDEIDGEEPVDENLGVLSHIALG